VAEIVLDNVTKRYPTAASRRQDQPVTSPTASSSSGRPVGLREVHDAQHDRRAGGHHRGRAADRRQGGEQRGPKDRDIAMVFQSYALYPHMTCGEHGLRAQVAKTPQKRHQREGRERARSSTSPSTWTVSPPTCPAAQRQRVAMGRGHRARPAGLPHGRAAVEPRRQAPGADSHVGLRLQRRLGTTMVYVTHDRPRHDAGRPARRDAQRVLRRRDPKEPTTGRVNLFVAASSARRR